MVWVCQMVIKKIWLPFDGGGMSNGDQRFLVTEKRGHVTCFWKPFDNFLKRSHKWAFCDDWIFFITMVIIRGLIKNFPSPSNTRMAIEIFESPKRACWGGCFLKRWYYMCKYIHKIRSWGCTLSKDFNDYYFKGFWVYIKNIPFVRCKKL